MSEPQGIFDLVKPEAAFGLHVSASLETGTIGYRPGPMMAASDSYRMVVRGRQSHGARPWAGVDPIVVASQVVMGMQTIVSRQTDITRYPVVLSVGAIKGGIRSNIIPDEVELIGTLRTFDPEVRRQTIERLTRTATDIAHSAGAAATVEIGEHPYPVLVNNAGLAARMRPTFERVAADGRVVEIPYLTSTEDFAFYAQRVPSLFFSVGVTPAGADMAQVAGVHSHLFRLDEAALPYGLRAMLGVAVDYLQGTQR